MSLPDDVLRHIVEFAGLEDCLSFSKVCWTYRNIINVPEAVAEMREKRIAMEAELDTMNYCIKTRHEFLEVLAKEIDTLDMQCTYPTACPSNYLPNDCWWLKLVGPENSSFISFQRPMTLRGAVWHLGMAVDEQVNTALACISASKRDRNLCAHSSIFKRRPPPVCSLSKETIVMWQAAAQKSFQELVDLRDRVMVHPVPAHAFV